MCCNLSGIISGVMTVPLTQKMNGTYNIEESPFLKELRLFQ